MEWIITEMAKIWYGIWLDLVANILKTTMKMVSDVGKTNLDNAGLVEWVSRVMGVSIPLIIIFLTFNVVGTALKMGGVPSLGPAVKAGLIAVVGTGLMVPIVKLLNDVSEALVEGTIKVMGTDMNKTVQAVKTDTSITSIPTMLMLMLVGLFLVIVCILILIILLIRDVILYVTIVVGPIALAGAAWGTASAWPRKWITSLVAVIFTKWAIFLTLAVGFAMMKTSLTEGILGDIGQFLQILVLFIAACFAPLFTFKFFDFMGESVVAAMQPSGYQARQAAHAGKQAVTSAKNAMSSIKAAITKSHPTTAAAGVVGGVATSGATAGAGAGSAGGAASTAFTSGLGSMGRTGGAAMSAKTNPYAGPVSGKTSASPGGYSSPDVDMHSELSGTSPVSSQAALPDTQTLPAQTPATFESGQVSGTSPQNATINDSNVSGIPPTQAPNLNNTRDTAPTQVIQAQSGAQTPQTLPTPTGSTHSNVTSQPVTSEAHPTPAGGTTNTTSGKPVGGKQ